ncbi:MAG TPA: DoxX family protein [Patescibacteria group bacterium]|nr:DoxX family protein [Patescibacteria group bacterium]
MLSLSRLVDSWRDLIARLRAVGEILPRLILRLIMGWEFFEAGREKLQGENWFASIQSDFPVPFNVIPANVSWTLATWFELVGAVALWIGFGTRFFAFGLLVLTFVATAAVHWPDIGSMWSDLLKGYAISDQGNGNFKLPLLFVVMLLPLIFNGPGKLSVDHLVAKWFGADAWPQPNSDLYAWSLAAVVFGLPFLFLIPSVGFVLLGLALLLAGFQRFVRG